MGLWAHLAVLDHIHVTTEAATGAATILVDQSGQCDHVM